MGIKGLTGLLKQLAPRAFTEKVLKSYCGRKVNEYDRFEDVVLSSSLL